MQGKYRFERGISDGEFWHVFIYGVCCAPLRILCMSGIFMKQFLFYYEFFGDLGTKKETNQMICFF